MSTETSIVSDAELSRRLAELNRRYLHRDNINSQRLTEQVCLVGLGLTFTICVALIYKFTNNRLSMISLDLFDLCLTKVK